MADYINLIYAVNGRWKFVTFGMDGPRFIVPTRITAVIKHPSSRGAQRRGDPELVKCLNMTGWSISVSQRNMHAIWGVDEGKGIQELPPPKQHPVHFT